jgi:hypothetical protein
MSQKLDLSPSIVVKINICLFLNDFDRVVKTIILKSTKIATGDFLGYLMPKVAFCKYWGKLLKVCPC